MKKALVILIVLTLSPFAYCEDGIKVGFVNFQRALNECEVGKKTKAELEKLVLKRQAPINEKIRQKEALEEEYQRQSVTLSEDAAKKRVDEIQKMRRDIERMISDYNADMEKIQREKEDSILKDLGAIISTLAAEEKYTFILPTDVIIYAVDEADITDKVVRKYDAIGEGALKKLEKK
jgi:outer membrane protein